MTKLLWERGQHRRAFQVLTGLLDKLGGSDVCAGRQVQVGNVTAAASEDPSAIDATTGPILPAVLANDANRNVYAKAYLLLSKWKEHTNSSNPNTIVLGYNEVSKALPHWEKVYFCVGRFYNKLYESEKESEPLNSSRPLAAIIYSFRSLLCSCAKTMFVHCVTAQSTSTKRYLACSRCGSTLVRHVVSSRRPKVGKQFGQRRHSRH